jgi:hypothetical protein
MVSGLIDSLIADAEAVRECDRITAKSRTGRLKNLPFAPVSLSSHCVAATVLPNGHVAIGQSGCHDEIQGRLVTGVCFT